MAQVFPDGSPNVDELVRLLSSGSLPVGFAFRPMDLELMSCLVLKNAGLLRAVDELLIPVVYVYDQDPWVLAEKSSFQSSDPVWHFFSTIVLKFPNRKILNRATPSGHWKVTGKEREITHSTGGFPTVLGKKKTLVYYQGSAPNCFRTNWSIHEYNTVNEQGPFVLCRLQKKPDETGFTIEKKCEGTFYEGESSAFSTAAIISPLQINVVFGGGNSTTVEAENQVVYSDDHDPSYLASGGIGVKDNAFTAAQGELFQDDSFQAFLEKLDDLQSEVSSDEVPMVPEGNF